MTAVCQTSSEMAQVGGDYGETITCPPFFEELMLPRLARAAEVPHRRGKLCIGVELSASACLPGARESGPPQSRFRARWGKPEGL